MYVSFSIRTQEKSVTEMLIMEKQKDRKPICSAVKYFVHSDTSTTEDNDMQ